MAKKPVELDEKDLIKSTARIRDAWDELRKHVLIGPLAFRAKLHVIGYQPQQPAMFVTVSGAGDLFANPYNWPRKKEEWIFVLAHALLHLAFGHFKHVKRGMVWNVVCDCIVNEFLGRMKIGSPPEGLLRLPPGVPNNEEKLFQMWTRDGGAPQGETTNGRAADMVAAPDKKNFEDIFARAVRAAARKALSSAGGDELTRAGNARAWFIKNYPLIGSVLQLFTLDEDALYCERRSVRIAAIDSAKRKILINPGWAMTDQELRFVLGHLALHAGFQQGARRGARDPFVWNAACDYCVNEWLDKMPPVARAVKAPSEGHLRSVLFDGLTPAEIYQRLMENQRAASKLVTFAGQGACDMLSPEHLAPLSADAPVPRAHIDRIIVDALLRGHQIHVESGKGPLPAALLDELRGLENPPPPWDVQLGRWFDENIPPLERVRTYGRPSRRQSATPGIARPRYIWPEFESAVKGTLGLIVDVSGALDTLHATLALGAITTYALSRAIPKVRLVLSGAELIDEGMTSCDDLLQKFKLSERARPAMQPAVELLDKAIDFPEDAPMLLLTGLPCDRIVTQRTHAYLIPEEGQLSYKSDAPVIGIVAD